MWWTIRDHEARRLTLFKKTLGLLFPLQREVFTEQRRAYSQDLLCVSMFRDEVHTRTVKKKREKHT